MGWNEPPGGGKDPWGNRGNGQGPPDLDEIIRKMQNGFGGMFGRKPAGIGGDRTPLVWLLILVIALVYVLVDVTYFVDQQERGVVLRFGRYARTLQPGLNFVLPTPVDDVRRINVGQVRSITHKANMLTQDENIVDVEVAVQWRISDPAAYMFNVKSPELTLRQVAESAVRSVIGKSKLDFVLTEGRSQIAQDQQELMQQILDAYKSGILVVTVEMQPAKPPEAVKAAFDDAIKAREDEQRLVNEAQAYRNDIIPKARGGAARLREEAAGYKARVIARAEGDAARFEQLLTEYERAPAITRQRLYIETLESVLANTNKVLLDAKNSNSLMYLPIDRLMGGGGNSARTLTLPRDIGSDESIKTAVQELRNRVNDRARGVR